MSKPKRFSVQEFIQQLDQIIERLIKAKQTRPELMQTDVQIGDIAKVFDVNSATLRRWCQECTGLSPRQYLAIYRVEQAKHLLRLGLKPAKVSQKLAFTEHKNFSTLFKRVHGMSPSDFLYNSI
ncbi:MAG: AraC-like DNA-binding protein [Bermanella sp.]|jgi:AraC-like DNA-binding protein